MKRRIKSQELTALANRFGFEIQHDCGGYRVVDDKGAHVFPEGGVCPTVSKREAYVFLLGYYTGRKDLAGQF